MECKIKNDIGTIYITEDVMLKVVGYAALECYGIVAMSSKRAKDGLVQWLGRENLSKGVQLRLVDDMLDVDLFIIVEYGISIAEVCKTIVETVRYKLESMTGVKDVYKRQPAWCPLRTCRPGKKRSTTPSGVSRMKATLAWKTPAPSRWTCLLYTSRCV